MSGNILAPNNGPGKKAVQSWGQHFNAAQEVAVYHKSINFLNFTFPFNHTDLCQGVGMGGGWVGWGLKALTDNVRNYVDYSPRSLSFNRDACHWILCLCRAEPLMESYNWLECGSANNVAPVPVAFQTGPPVPTGCGNVCKECAPPPLERSCTGRGGHWTLGCRREFRRTPGSTGVANGMRTSTTKSLLLFECSWCSWFDTFGSIVGSYYIRKVWDIFFHL